MQKVLVAFLLTVILCSCVLSSQQNDEYLADRKAYQECIENESDMDDCIFNYVKYLPENIQKEME